jgi:hypothetical protein
MQPNLFNPSSTGFQANAPSFFGNQNTNNLFGSQSTKNLVPPGGFKVAPANILFGAPSIQQLIKKQKMTLR